MKCGLKISELTALLLFVLTPLCAQKGRKVAFDLSPAIKLTYHLGVNSSYKESGSHFTLGIAVAKSVRSAKSPFAMYLQSGVNIYAAGLGANVINTYYGTDPQGNSFERRRKLEFDFVNSAMLNIEAGKEIHVHDQALFPVHHFNHMTPSLNFLHKAFTVTYGVNYIFNTSQRNQNVAFAGISSPWISGGMYNDGGIPLFFLGDYYDRFWTGGGYLRVAPLYRLNGDRSGIYKTSVEYSFHRFTHDVQDGYRLANLLEVPYVQDASLYNILYNNSLASLKVNFPNNLSVSVSTIGKLKFDVQDLIHKKRGYSKHSTLKARENLVSVFYSPLK